MKEELYDRYLNDDLSEEEKASLIDYIHEEDLSEDFAQYIIDTASMVGLSEKILSEKSRTKKVQQKSRPKTRRKSRQKKKSPIMFWLASVAALIAVSFIILSKKKLVDSGLYLQSCDELSFIERDGGEISTDKLQKGDLIYSAKKAIIKDQDGSIIELSEDSSLLIISTGKNKGFKLIKGRVNCDISPQKGEFQVKSQWFDVIVIGTKFTVVSTPGEGKILVDSGSVKCEVGETSKTLKEDDVLIADKKNFYLGLEDILTSRKWMMEWERTDSSVGNRLLSFNKQGAISVGANVDESFWEMDNNVLKILDKNRKLRFKVKYDFDSGEWIQAGQTGHGYKYKLKKD